jgi:O-antigen/teichoic acid export membrane protein
VSDTRAAEPGSPRSGADEATKGSAIKLLTELLARLVGLATAFVISRHFGVEAFGVFGWFSVVAVVLAEAADLGLQGTASQALVARSLSWRAIVRAKLLISTLVMLAAMAAAPFVPVLAPLVAFFTLAGWSEILGVALRARGDRLHESLVIFCLRVSGLLLVLAAIGAGAGLPGLAWAHAASPVAPILLCVFLLRRRTEPDPGPDPGFSAVLRRSAPLAVQGGLALLSLRVEFLALGLLAGDREAGLFLASLRVVEFLNLVPSAICAGAMPALTREALRARGDAVRRRTAATMAFLAVPAAAGVALVAPGLMALFGEEFTDARALVLLAPALVPLFLNALLVSALIAAERAPWLPRLTAIRVASAALLALALVPRLGATGAAVGFLLSELLLLVILSHAATAALFPVSLPGPFARAALAALPMAAVVALTPALLPARVAAGVLTYGLTLTGAWHLAPRLVRDLAGDVRYPWEGDERP